MAMELLDEIFSYIRDPFAAPPMYFTKWKCFRMQYVGILFHFYYVVLCHTLPLSLQTHSQLERTCKVTVLTELC